MRKENWVFASDAEIGDYVTFRGEEWEVTDVTYHDKGEQVRLQLRRGTDDDKEVTEWFLFDDYEELE
jgi:hypothetical protein